MPEETGNTYLENSVIKAVSIARATGMITIADDSGLEVAALDGRPGLYSSRYGNSDDERIERLLSELAGHTPSPAKFVCVATVARPDGFSESFEGFISGEIVDSRSGSFGFGFDPVFMVNDYGCTMAELTSQIKNRISHRAVAFKKLFEHIIVSESLYR
jgi:XTP/dITP diphosphohydrolase